MIKLFCLTFFVAASVVPALGQQQTVPERVAALKASMAASHAVLKQYEWIETTVVSLKGEEKSRQQDRCYYGAEGGVQKIEISESPEAKRKRGLRGRIVERKTEELTDYMKSAVALVKNYVPPSPEKIQAVKDAGGVSVNIVEPGKLARLDFKSYLKPGDTLSVEVNLTNNRPTAMKVASYLDDPSDAITLNVRMGKLDDGTTYPANSVLNAPDKNLTVTVTHSGYRKMN